MQKKAALIIFTLLVVVVLVLALLNLSKTIPTPSPKTTPTTLVVTIPVVTVTNKGFLPQAIKIKKGQQVKWVNQDSQAHQIAADPYPTHSSLPKFFSKALLTSDSYTFTFNQAGKFTYQDYLKPLSFKGTVIVE